MKKYITIISDTLTDAPSGQEIIDQCEEICNMLISKNIAYGNSALEPINIFSNVDAKEQIAIRIDDKLNRLAKGNEYAGDDTILDLIGYLILYRIALDNTDPEWL